ncbi:MAG: C25 family cysteine peptidase, partial [Planctomycetota bacterium]|nr:C25 family cysteine peptidase [Planctomycetota bacterium]
GIATSVVAVGSIGNNSTSIKNYIQDVYDTTDLAFVLLVGDIAQVDSPVVGYAASDPTYSKLEGGDDYPDIMVGRFSAESPGDVDTQVQRTIEYENMPATEQDWFWRGMGVASNQGTGDDGEYDDEHVDNIRDLLLDYGYTEVDQIYDPYGTAQQVTDGLHAGRGIITYTGHGWIQGWGSTGFSNDHVNALQNDNMLPFITSVACNTGEFDGGTCFGEAWMRATHNGEPTGAIGFYGSTISQSWSPPMQMQDEFADLYTTEQYNCYGTLCYAGSCSMMDDYGGDGVNEFNYWTIFGDPSLRIVGTVAPPTGMKVSPSSGLSSEGPNGGPFTPESIMYTLTNYDPNPLDYTVSKTADWIALDNTGGTIPVGGSVDVTVSISDYAEGMGNGHYEDVVEFVNTTNHDGDCTRTATLDIGVPMPVYVFDMDDSPGWSMTGEWAFGHPTGQGGYSHGYSDPDSGATGDNVCGVNLNGDYSTTPGGPYWLTTGAIDCAELTKVELHFQRWLNSDYQPFVYAMLEVSTDGASWDQLWENGGDEVAENSWSEHVFDLSEIADNEPTLYVRWGYQVESGAWAYSGWNLDDVEIWGVEPSGGCPEDLNGDGVVNTADLLILLENWGTAGDGDIDGDGEVDTADLLALLSAWGNCP